MSKPQNHQLITAVEFLLVFSRLIGFSLAYMCNYDLIQ